jgi:hypothetical protein
MEREVIDAKELSDISGGGSAAALETGGSE